MHHVISYYCQRVQPIKRVAQYITFFALFIPSSLWAAQIPESWQISDRDLKKIEGGFRQLARDRFKGAEQYAHKVSTPLVKEYFAWRKHVSGSRYSSTQDTRAFAKRYPSWPKMNALWVRIERDLQEDMPTSDIIELFQVQGELRMPVTSFGKMLLGKAMYRNGVPEDDALAVSLLQDAFVSVALSSSAEKKMIKEFADVLDQDTIRKRTNYLVWNNRFTEAKRLLKRLDTDEQHLFKARILLRSGRYGIDRLINKIPESMRADDGLVYDRIRWRERHKVTKNMNELLSAVPAQKQYPETFWKTLPKYIAALREVGNYSLAYKLASEHGFSEDKAAGYAEGEWLAGWIALRFLNDPRAAYKHFYRIFQMAKTPVTLGRAAYWAARSAEVNRNEDIAQNWYEVAARYPTSFYGQLAWTRINPRHFYIETPPMLPAIDYGRYEHHSLMRIAYMLYQVNQPSQAFQFLSTAFEQYTDLQTRYHIIWLARMHGYMEHVIHLANKMSYHNGPVLLQLAYPTLNEWRDKDWHTVSKPEFGLIHAIIRQESRFNQWARSGANALGMMQLLPSTAKDVARRNRMKYSQARLTRDPFYNVRLGSAYLDSRLDYFDGSYVLATASYNGGTGNVNRWLERYGDPRDLQSVEAVVDWVEGIPFKETRNYVMRVLEQLQIYRLRLSGKMRSDLTLTEDLLR